MKYNRISAKDALKATSPFIAVRSLVYLVSILIMAVAAVIGLLLISTGISIVAWIGVFIFIGSIVAVKWIERYILYMIKAGQIFAITQYIKTGQAPVTEKGYKGVLAFGTEKVKDNFGATNVAFVADRLIAGAVRQIMRFVNKAGDLLSFIPGVEVIMNIVSLILGIALSYIDEAVLSYIFMHKDEENVWKNACDAIVYYGQSWKGILKGASKVAITILLARIGIVGVAFFVGLGIGGGVGAVAGLIIGYIVMFAINKMLLDPFATIVMINDYYAAIEGQELKADMYGTFAKASSKFKELFGKSKEEVAA